MAVTEPAILAHLFTLAILVLQTVALDFQPQLPERLQPYLHLINLTHFEKVHSETALRADWLSWTKSHGKKYPTGRRELERFAVWKSNKVYIDYHNQFEQVFGYRLAMNQFGDMSTEEYLYYMKCLESAKYYEPDNDAIVTYFDPSEYTNETLPEEMDWRNQGIISEVKDQGRCRSCYAFAVAGVLESMNALATGKIVTLSEQNIIDCSIPYGNRGCSGGSRLSSLLYVIDSGGLDSEDSYPYSARQYLCRYSRTATVGSCTGMVRIHKGMEYDLMTAVALAGPVTVAIDSKHYSFQFYQDGVYDEPECSSTNLTHSLLIVGYGTDEQGKDYWLLKNSWGITWGNNGYIKMARNSNNQCGIATRALFPTS